MRAIVLRELGGPAQFRLEEVEKPIPNAHEVLIKLKASALNRRDIYVRMGQYPGIKIPAIPGADGAGVLEDGSEVIINPALNWGENENFYSKSFHIIGVPSNGTFAEYIKVPKENIFPKPAYLSWEEAAALPLGGLTAYRALFTRGKLQEGETVLIPGIGGGVASFLLQMAVAVKAKVFVTSSSEEKIRKAISMGASGGVNYKEEGWDRLLKEQMKGSADLIVDSVGGYSFSKLINIANNGGRIVSFGATAGPIPQIVMPKIFFKHLDILGSTMGSPRDFTNMLKLYEEHQLRPAIDSVFSLEEIQQAQDRIENGSNFGKVVLKISSMS
jgi:NADPH:quinone reductase-like Zn-dependent oxidoreductase